MVDLEVELISSSIYGAIKIDFRPNEGNFYWVYGFKHEEEFWDFNKGELLLVTNNVNLINTIQNKFQTIDQDVQFCEICFKHKKIATIYGFEIEKWIPKDVMVKIQSRFLMEFPELGWRNFQHVASNYIVSLGACENCLGIETSFNLDYRDTILKMVKIINQAVSNYIIKNNHKSILEKYLIQRIELIEEGLTFVECQKRVGTGGVIDILAKDINDRPCVIELKTNAIEKSVVWQAASYQTEFEEDIRVIIISLKYPPFISKALKNIKNTELKFYQLDDEGLLKIENYLY